MVMGEMFYVHQRVAKCVDIESGCGWFKYIDDDGTVRTITAPASAATPLRTVLDPRSKWPEGGHLDVLEAEREERARQAERKAQAKASRKAKRSMKIKRGVPA